VSSFVRVVLCVFAIIVGLSVHLSEGVDVQAFAEGGGVKMVLKSPAFSEGDMIPRKYTCDGANVSPPLTWSGVPAGVKSLALICDDPDAPRGTFVHWVVFNIPPSSSGLREGLSNDKTLQDGSKQGLNDFRRIGYGGPCPPSGTHRYYFKLYALDTELGLDPGATKKELLEAMEGHILAEASLMGKYRR
jgi:Raf kinase inhibitor-like YbhB/YbcL family protein